MKPMIKSARSAFSSSTTSLSQQTKLLLSISRHSNPLSSSPKPRGQFQLNANVIPLLAKIEVSVEDLATLQSLDVVSSKKIERLAMKVGENLFNFIQSFCGVDWSKLVVLLDILDRWFKKFQEGAKCDPKCF
ncbi:hypothetical protein FEM48_Zijuj02G0078100 [Ziziphus jujuba var. spinosa]|uniref:Hikeshi-like C-terminal domain-containing protein n=1 Tax=Ziziphus jujuba var. spinosa TaxID=714518 RepID=A0A978VUI4_ZIZJJ|nr:hypothetical protein FEM48_Zijuj02G0078100 [Ziziphus jujuba var. spinosa]